MRGTALCSKTNPVVQSVNEALVVGSLLPLCCEPNGCPVDEVEDGRERKERFCIDSNRDIWMGSDQLTAFKDPCYGISVHYSPMVRGSLLFGGMGDRNALLRSSWFFAVPHRLQAAAFSSCQ